MNHLTGTKDQKGITDMAEHKHGEMDISVQEKTFEGFISMTTKATIVILLILVFLALVGA